MACTTALVVLIGGLVHGDLYGQGFRGVVLAHGGRFTKETQPTSADDVHLDVLAVVRYLHATGAETVSVVGASFGGGAAARAAVDAG